MTRTIDLNADAGEDPAALVDGREERLVRAVTSVNAATGGHAGDPRTLDALARLCATHNTALNAHPSYPDRAGFGRATMTITRDALLASLRDQLALADDAARAHAITVSRVKPHGALYHDAANDRDVARTLADACARPTEIVLPPTATTREVFAQAGHTIVPEGFADRGYTDAGALLPRTEPGALIDNPDDAATQALALALSQRVRTLCVHSDTPNALAIARRVRERLAHAGWTVAR
ncbi:MAG: LamB/YcsF family protein [Planctomycetota bacterium]